MLSRYVEWEGYRPIPLTGNKYLISMNGDIIDTIRGVTLFSGKNDRVEIFDGYTFKTYKRSTLICLLSKVCKIPNKYWNQLDTLPIDGNDNNTNASNLIWKFPKDGLRVSFNNDFSYVPGFTRYSINKDGVLYSHATNKILSPYQDEMGYWMYGCQPDVGKRTIVGRHRLLALAYLEYPCNVDDLDVNHKDGVKTNCLLSNLEWGSRKHNCDHAYSTGLRTDNVEVSVMNSFTGEVNDYYSFEECARNLGYDGETIRLRVKSAGQKVFSPGLQFKKKNDKTDWKKFSDPKSEMSGIGFDKETSLRNLKNNEIITFKTFKDCSVFLNIKPATLAWRIKNHPGKPINDFIIL